MKLLEKQFKFTRAIGFLLEFAFKHGYFLTFGTAYRSPKYNKFIGGHPKSNHPKRLAVDFNLFVDGEYIKDSKHIAWVVLHNEFERLGGAKMIKKDANHFSFKHGGIR
jgi:hypothetical protein